MKNYKQRPYVRPQFIKIRVEAQLLSLSLNNQVSDKPAYAPSKGKGWEAGNWSPKKEWQ